LSAEGFLPLEAPFALVLAPLPFEALLPVDFPLTGFPLEAPLPVDLPLSFEADLPVDLPLVAAFPLEAPLPVDLPFPFEALLPVDLPLVAAFPLEAPLPVDLPLVALEADLDVAAFFPLAPLGFSVLPLSEAFLVSFAGLDLLLLAFLEASGLA